MHAVAHAAIGVGLGIIAGIGNSMTVASAVLRLNRDANCMLGRSMTR